MEITTIIMSDSVERLELEWAKYGTLWNNISNMDE